MKVEGTSLDHGESPHAEPGEPEFERGNPPSATILTCHERLLPATIIYFACSSCVVVSVVVVVFL
jgi:hypothetical protein